MRRCRLLCPSGLRPCAPRFAVLAWPVQSLLPSRAAPGPRVLGFACGPRQGLSLFPLTARLRRPVGTHGREVLRGPCEGPSHQGERHGLDLTFRLNRISSFPSFLI